jgi:hypothetical protein
MADNIKVDEGTGPNVATDLISIDGAEAHVQRVKQVVGVAGSGADVSAANPLPVDDDASQVLLTAIKALLEGTGVVKVTDNAGSLTVDAPLATPVGVRLSDGSEPIGTTAKRLHVDDGGTTLSVDDGAGSLTVDGTVAVSKVEKLEGELPAGTKSIGTVVLGAGSAAAGKIIVTALEGEPKVKVAELPATPAGSNEIGKVKVTELPALPTGANAIGKLAEGAAVIGKVGLAPQTSGGLLIKRLLAAASTNATSVKAEAGQVFGWYIFNSASSIRYLKLYNKASAPTVGTDTPVITLPIPKEAGANVEFVNGIAFATGISLATTKGVADANSEAVAENDLIVNLFYK